ncbi:MAG TPA: cytochrome C [Oxalobacteraceae bacterium]|nr:cytochrome C [Oxalobacteraceae bacterium]
MPLPLRTHLHRAVFGLFAVVCIVRPAMADDDRRAARVPPLPKYQQECTACHVAYPPGMLPAASWQRVMNNLPHHYGTDASLDPATAKQLSNWLGANAGTYKRVREEPSEDRITRSAWFIRKHDEVSARTWKLPAVKSASNCAACHIRADQGEFNEHDVRIPR